jgi:hypothetical protein
MSVALAVLPMVWATAQIEHVDKVAEPKPVPPELAFYRKYTEALLRRYAHMSMELGRVPSLLGKEMFRGKVTNYTVHGFDDVVIFVHDVERCMEVLDLEQYELVSRIAVQEYTQVEAAALMRMPVRTLLRRYDETLDLLTEVMLKRRLLEPLIACQEGRSVN